MGAMGKVEAGIAGLPAAWIQSGAWLPALERISERRP
jgi:hypothetical protein